MIDIDKLRSLDEAFNLDLAQKLIASKRHHLPRWMQEKAVAEIVDNRAAVLSLTEENRRLRGACRASPHCRRPLHNGGQVMLHPPLVEQCHQADDRAGCLSAPGFDPLNLPCCDAKPFGQAGDIVSAAFADGAEGAWLHKLPLDRMTTVPAVNNRHGALRIALHLALGDNPRVFECVGSVNQFGAIKSVVGMDQVIVHCSSPCLLIFSAGPFAATVTLPVAAVVFLAADPASLSGDGSLSAPASLGICAQRPERLILVTHGRGEHPALLAFAVDELGAESLGTRDEHLIVSGESDEPAVVLEFDGLENRAGHLSSPLDETLICDQWSQRNSKITPFAIFFRQQNTKGD